MNDSAVQSAFAAARKARGGWADRPLGERLKCVKKFRHQLAECGAEWARELAPAFRDSPVEVLASEVIPLAEACRYLERTAPSLLRRRRRSSRFWPLGIRIYEDRDPFGIVLIIGPSNYPLFLPGTQAIQAIVAGNVVLIKPGRGGTVAAQKIADLANSSGLPPGALQFLPEATEAAEEAIACRPDKVVMTGSAESGRAVLRQLAEGLIPGTVELSGCDAVFVREDADLDRVVDVIRFGLTWNGSATCIAPRRVFVASPLAETLNHRLESMIGGLDPLPLPRENRDALRETAARLDESGARRLCGHIDMEGAAVPFLFDCGEGMVPPLGDVFAPILTMTAVESDGEALELDAQCPFSLGAVVFGRERGARKLARRIDAGCVTINDAIAPTADPRISFGGRHRSGYGVTRGPLGLLDLTVPKLTAIRRGRFLPHLREVTADTTKLLESSLALKHGAGIRRRFKALRSLSSAVKRIGRREKDR